MKISLAITAALLAAGSAFSLVSAQTPPLTPPTTSSMVVSALVPAVAGTDVRIEALDPVTIRSVDCGHAATSADATTTSASRLSLAVDSSCVKATSGNLRICWGSKQCSALEFKPGQSLELGLLSTKVTESPPNPGLGAHDDHMAQANTLSDKLHFAALASLILGVGGMLGTAGYWRRRRRADTFR